MNTLKAMIWRFVKVAYFFVTIPLVGLFIFILEDTHRITRVLSDGEFYTVMNYWSYLAVILLIIAGYVILTDGLRKLIAYIMSGSFEEGISYKNIVKKFRYVVLLGALVFGALLYMGSRFEYQVRHFCNGEGDVLSQDGTCNCDDTAEMVDGKCEVKEEIKEVRMLTGLVAEYFGSENVMLLEYSYLPGNQNKGIGIVMKNPITSKVIDEDLSGESYDISCPASVEGLINISGEAYIFAFSKNEDIIKIDDIKKIPSPGQYFSYTYPLIHTKQNSYLYFGGEKPTSEMDGNRLVRQYVIERRDFNGDGEFNEFVLEGYFDGMCGFHNYLFVGYDKKLDQILFYDFSGKVTATGAGFDSLYWTWLVGDIKDKFSNGTLHQETFCWTQTGGDSDESRDRVYNPQKKVFEMKNYYSRKCSPDEF